MICSQTLGLKELLSECDRRGEKKRPAKRSGGVSRKKKDCLLADTGVRACQLSRRGTLPGADVLRQYAQ